MVITAQEFPPMECEERTLSAGPTFAWKNPRVVKVEAGRAY